MSLILPTPFAMQGTLKTLQLRKPRVGQLLACHLTARFMTMLLLAAEALQR
jgi:hypothetical protein